MKKAILTILVLSTCLIVEAKNDTGETRTAKVTIEVNRSDEIDIQAKHTDLIVEAWNRDEVHVEATIRFDGKMTNRMQRFLDAFDEEVKSQITEGPGEVIIKTSLNEPNKFQLGSAYLGIQIGFNEDELKLSYLVKVPAANSIKIKNSYKDLVLTGDFEDVLIDQYSGELEAESIEKAEIKLKYGSATFDRLGSAEMDLYEQDLSVGSIDELSITTKYSDLKIQNLGDTEIVSYETDFEVGTISSIEGNLKYGKIEVTERWEKGEITTYEFDIDAKEIVELTMENSKYGKFEARTVNNLRLVQSYEDEFEIEELSSLKADQTKYGKYDIERLNGVFAFTASYEDDVTINEIGEKATTIDLTGKYVDTSLDLAGASYKLVVDGKYGKVDIDKTSSTITKYIKDGDQLEIEAAYTITGKSPILIQIKGYEMDLDLD